MNSVCFFRVRSAFLTILLLLPASSLIMQGQSTGYTFYYRIYLKDKGENNTGTITASQILSSRAIGRRQKAGITVPDYRDLPVSQSYLNQISLAGFTLHCTSKWMNTALFKTRSQADVKVLLGLPFVKEVKIVKSPGFKGIITDKLDFRIFQTGQPPYDRPITMVNGYPLHNSGFDGNNIMIAILDGGFLNGDQINSINHLRARNGIIKTYDFVNKSPQVYNASTHGTAVLSILAGVITGQLEGTAPGAEYLLLKTEDVQTEFPCEEDFWAAGAEYADSCGADIISSSLGYCNFDNPSLNYKYSNLDGNTAFVTIAADIAASKGILVVNSAGNERNKAWKRIIFPSDGDSVICSGAVDGNNLISDFSSAGPAADRRVKPDNVTMGVSVPLQVTAGNVDRGSGTSFSCPVLSGMAACLMQAVPQALNQDIIDVLHSSSDRFSTPDSLYGYGIPDMVASLKKLQEKYVIIPENKPVAKPNPTTGDFEIVFRESQTEITVEIITLDGKLIYRNDFNNYAGRTILITGLRNREHGIYFTRVITNTGTWVFKIVRLKD